MTDPIVTIFARWPEPGKAKTRLIPGLGPEGAATVYRRLLEHTVAEARASGLAVELRVTGGSPEAFHAWLGDGFALVDQGGGDLGEKLVRVPAPTLLIGSDCPGLSAPLLRDAAAALQDNSAVIGPATDGGYYLLGLARPMPFLFQDMPWSTSEVLPETLRRMKQHQIEPVVLATLDDIDTPEDLARHSAFAPEVQK